MIDGPGIFLETSIVAGSGLFGSVVGAATVLSGVAWTWQHANPREALVKWQEVVLIREAHWLKQKQKMMKRERRQDLKHYQHRTRLFGTVKDRQILGWAININNAYHRKARRRSRLVLWTANAVLIIYVVWSLVLH